MAERTGAVNPAFTWRPDDTSSLNVNFEYISADYVPDSGIPVLGDMIAPVDSDTDYQSPLDDSQQDIFRLQADYQKALSSAVSCRIAPSKSCAGCIRALLATLTR